MGDRRPLAALVALLALFMMGSEYRGCGNAGRPEDGVPIPGRDGGGGCLVDSDCGVDDCSTLACVAGECVRAGARYDADSDGRQPPPCGDDCDDNDPRVRPEAPELCDAIDQDCDGTIDEDATGVLYELVDDGLFDAHIVGLADRFAVVGRTDIGAVRGYLVGLDGSRSEASDLVLVPTPDEPVEVFAVASAGERFSIAFARARRGAELAEIVLEGERLRVATIVPIGIEEDVVSIAAHVFAGETWVAFDTVVDTGEQRRWLWGSVSRAPVALAASDAGPAIADDGANLVVADGDRTLSFRSDGEVARHVLPRELAEGKPLASDAGSVIVAHRDAFDYLLTSVNTSSSRSPTTAPSGLVADRLALYVVPEGVLFTRHGANGPRAWILAPDLRTIVASFDAGDLSPMSFGPTRMSAATAGEATTILTSYEGTSVLASLACTTSP